MRRRHSVAIIFLCVLFLVSGCATPVLYTCEGISRDTTWIRVGKEGGTYAVNRIVGGEHITRYRILGFEGERYRVSGYGEDLYMSVEPSDAFKFSVTDAPNTVIVEVIGLDALISVELSAHPVSEYRLTVEKIE